MSDEQKFRKTSEWNTYFNINNSQNECNVTDLDLSSRY